VPAVLVPDRLTRHVAAGHPWLYRDAVPEVVGARSGEFVALLGQGRRPLGHALFDADSPIALRVVATRKDERPGPALWRRRVETAWRLRQTTLDLAATDAYRLLHGEGDRLPGVVVDLYAGHAVLKLDTAAWLPHLDDLTAAIVDLVRPKSLWFKGLSGQRSDGPEPPPARRPRLLAGEEPPPLVEIREHGMRMFVDIRRGQKTGMFLDQRENRRLIRQVARGREVLNLFSYTGGFSLAAALGGATRVTSVDVARNAVSAARDNFAANDLDPAAHAFVAADAFAFLDESIDVYDLVIVDPPSFAPNQKSVRAAESAYARLNASALRHVRPGGLLAAASCSSHIPLDAFLKILAESSRLARRPLRLLEIRNEPPDHPTPLHFPEGRYLKFVLAVAE
jgi:23S rRNA (cytosine1962-C5)-methyltransferase